MKKSAATFIFFITYLIACGQPLSSAAIDNLAERSMKAFDVPGIAVAVIKDGKVIHSKGYGVRSLNTLQQVDENTLFGIASNSKAFTAAALGMLVDEGKIKWEDKVRDYIPEFKLYSPYVTEEFTIKDLLTHRSGLGLGAGDLMFFPDSSDFVLKDIIYNLRFLKAVSGFRTKYDYDNNLYIVAGEVIARVSGESWDDFIEERIMKPIGMTHSGASFDRLKDKSDVIDGHAPVDGKVQVIARSSLKVGHSAGGINSSIADLSKWVMLQLANGKYGDGLTKQLFSEAVHEEMWTPQTIIPVHSPGPYNTHFASYGLGFGISDVKGYKQISHTGGLEGMVTQITMIPELNLGIIVLTNQQEGGAFSSITNQIKDAYFGIKGTDRVTEYAGRRKQSMDLEKKLTDSIWHEIQEAGKKIINKDYSSYIGTFTDKWFGDVFISTKNGKLWFDSKRSPKLTGEMFAYKSNSFVVKWRDRSMDADAFVSFSLDENGNASAITMKPISPLTDFSYDFQDLDLHRTK
ncbi:MAG TPA: serine hydrolase [Puia sp.]|jgi:CubicO group peptidase (beta-lactamase class C family)|nr:serine hydrolase [Puia sp.]